MGHHSSLIAPILMKVGDVVNHRLVNEQTFQLLKQILLNI
jgi:hypothetical protein